MKNRRKICRSTILGDFRFKTHIGTNIPPTLQNAFLATVQITPVFVDTYVRNNIVTKERTTSSRFFNAPEPCRATSQRANE